LKITFPRRSFSRCIIKASCSSLSQDFQQQIPFLPCSCLEVTAEGLPDRFYCAAVAPLALQEFFRHLSFFQFSPNSVLPKSPQTPASQALCKRADYQVNFRQSYERPEANRRNASGFLMCDPHSNCPHYPGRESATAGFIVPLIPAQSTISLGSAQFASSFPDPV